MTVTTTMPDDVVFGKVVGRFLLAVGDSFDDDRLPDATPASGTITFSPVVPNFKVNLPGPATVVKAPIRCSIDNTGRLLDTNQAVGVWLIAGHYRVTYALEGMTIDSHTIEVTTDHDDDTPLDLTNALPPSGPAITPTQYSELSGRLDAIDYPVDSVNGMLGDVVLDAADVGAYSKVETDGKFATQQALNDAKFEQVDQQLEAIDYPVDSVNGQTGNVVLDFPVDSVNGKTGAVVLDAGDVGALTQEQADQLYPPADALDFVGTYSGRWDSAKVYVEGDMVIIDDILWGAIDQNENVRPSINSQINPAGGDGGPGNYDLNQMYGGPQQIMHPIRLTRDVLVGSISLLAATAAGIPAMSVGIAAVRSVPGSSTAAQLISPETTTPAQTGGGWKEVVLSDPILLKAGTDYWVYIYSATGTGALNGMFANSEVYTGAMTAPTSRLELIRGNSGAAWADHDRHTYVQLGELEPQAWDALADLTLAPARTPIAWMTVSNPATDLRPDADHVIWNGGDVKPTNMGVDDIWIKA